MTKTKSKSRLPVCVLTKHPKRASGDKGVWEWTVTANGRLISKQTERVCNRAEAVRAMRQTLLALALRLMVEEGSEFNYANDGEPAADAM